VLLLSRHANWAGGSDSDCRSVRLLRIMKFME
jgi:hypothetical protein